MNHGTLNKEDYKYPNVYEDGYILETISEGNHHSVDPEKKEFNSNFNNLDTPDFTSSPSQQSTCAHPSSDLDSPKDGNQLKNFKEDNNVLDSHQSNGKNVNQEHGVSPKINHTPYPHTLDEDKSLPTPNYPQIQPFPMDYHKPNGNPTSPAFFNSTNSYEDDDSNYDDYQKKFSGNFSSDPSLYPLRRSNRVAMKPVSYKIEVGGSSNSTISEEDILDYCDKPKPPKKYKKRGRPPSNKKSPSIKVINDNKREKHVRKSHRVASSSSNSGSQSSDDNNLYRPKSALSFNPPNLRPVRMRAAVNYFEEENFDDQDEELYDHKEMEEDKVSLEPTRAINAFIDTRVVKKVDSKGKEIEVDEYLIKWVGKSYRDLEWCAVEDIQDCRGFGKIKKFLDDYNYLHWADNDFDITDEEKERRAIIINNQKDIIEDHKKIHRIISSRVSDSDKGPGIEYLCKWNGLGYEYCTWEPESSLQNDLHHIESFHKRESPTYMPKSGVVYGRVRPPYIPFKKQPDYIKNGELRDFQLYGVNWLASLWHKCYNGILADEMGLGKTVQTVSFLYYLFHSMKVYGPFLLILPLGTISAWEREFNKWAPDMNVVVYAGNAKSKSVIDEYEFYSNGSVKFNVLLTTYENIIKNKARLQTIKWAFLAVDEAHRLKNEASKLHRTLSNDLNRCNRLLITGTPLQNNVQELLSLIQFLMPEKIKGKDLQIDLEHTDSAELQIKMKEIKSILEEIMMRRLKKDVEQGLPGKTELILRIPMSEMQKKYYKAVFAKELASLFSNENGKIPLLSLRNIVVQLKKVSNHPYLFPNSRNLNASPEDSHRQMVVASGKLALLDKLLPRLKQENRRVLIFSQMVKMLDILTEYVEYKGYRYQRLDGTVPSEARKRAMEKFNSPSSPDFIFLLSTRAGGLGLNLETADTVILYDLDWNPQNDLQAIGRAHRIGQKNFVNVYRLVTAESIDEDIIERAKRKMVLEYAIIKEYESKGETDNAEKHINSIGEKLDNVTKDDLAFILKFGARRLFCDQNDQNNSSDLNERIGNDMTPIYDKNMETLDLDKVLKGAEKTNFNIESGISEGSSEFINRWNAVNVEVGDLSWNDIVSEKDKEKLLITARSLNLDGKSTEKNKPEISTSNSRTHPRHAKIVAKAVPSINIKKTRRGCDENHSESDGNADLNSDYSDGYKSEGSDTYTGTRNKRSLTLKSRNTTKRLAKKVRVASPVVKKKAPSLSNQSSDKEDGKFTLNSRCIGDLANAIAVYGDWHTRYDRIAALANLENEDRNIVINECEDIWEACKKAMKVRDSELSVIAQESPSRAKMERERAYFVMYKNVREINTQKIYDRVPQLKALIQELQKLKDIYSYRIGQVDYFFTSKWNCEPAWSTKDDSMLLVGIYKHGFGNWKAIQEDPKLDLDNKFFLGGERSKLDKDRKLPKKLHLDRRGTYLLREILNKSMANNTKSDHSPVPYLRSNPRPKRKIGTLSESKNSSNNKIENSVNPRLAAPSKCESYRLHDKNAQFSTSKYRTSSSSWAKAYTPEKKKRVSYPYINPPAKTSLFTQKHPKNYPSLIPIIESNSIKNNLKFEYNQQIGEMCKQYMRPVRKPLKAIRGSPDVHAKDMPNYINNLLYTEMPKVGSQMESVIRKNSNNDKERAILEAQLYRFISENFFLVNMRPPLHWSRCKAVWEKISSTLDINHHEKHSTKEDISSNTVSEEISDNGKNSLDKYNTPPVNVTNGEDINSQEKTSTYKRISHSPSTYTRHKAKAHYLNDNDIRSYYSNSSTSKNLALQIKKPAHPASVSRSSQNVPPVNERVTYRSSRRIRTS